MTSIAGFLSIRAAGLLALSAFVLLAGPNAAAVADSPAAKSYSRTVYSGAIRNPVNPKLTTFAEMMKLAFPKKSLRKIFNTQSHTTIFAPTNEAFETLLSSLTKDERDQLLDPNTGVLADILNYHFAAGDWQLADAPAQSSPGTPSDLVGGLKMADGAVANIYRSGSSRNIDGARVGTRLEFRNGVVQLIDKVINPPDGPAYVGCSPFTSEHTNYLWFNSPSSISMDWLGYIVTGCQPYGGPYDGSTGFTATDHASVAIIVDAGRSASSAPASAFKQGLTSDEMIVTGDFSDDEPGDLNFTVFGNMTLGFGSGETFTCENMRFGQGSWLGNNDWWAGQPGAETCGSICSGFEGLKLACTPSSGASGTLGICQVSSTTPDEYYTFNVVGVEDGQC